MFQEDIYTQLRHIKDDLLQIKDAVTDIRQSQSYKIEDPQFLDIFKVSQILQVSIGTIYNWVSSGKIPCIKVNGRLLFDRMEIDLLILERKKNGK